MKYKPSEKSPQITKLLEETTGRSTAISEERCANPPFGCGEKISGFRDSLSKKEYTISSLCQKCQDKVFGV